jgi:hypothetical protein
MTTETSPWIDLTFDQARRVDRNGKHDYFWAVIEGNAPAVYLALPLGTQQITPLPRIRSLDIRYRHVGNREALVISLRDAELLEPFEVLCRDVVSAGEVADDVREALDRSIRRTLRWHHLLRGGSSDRLSLEEQRGLIGELAFLHVLCGELGPRAAIETWHGPHGGAKDFELHGINVEVKARRGAAKPGVTISSIDQLADVVGSELFLRICSVDAAVRPAGLTLTDHVRQLEDLFAGSDLDAYAIWETSISASGFDWDHDYSDRRWSLGPTRTFAVAEGFPRLTPPIPAGVDKVTYSIAIDAMSNFEVEEQAFLRKLANSHHTDQG